MTESAPNNTKDEQRSNLIKLAADGALESHAGDMSGTATEWTHRDKARHHAALLGIGLTASNLERVPAAEQLAPGIRLDLQPACNARPDADTPPGTTQAGDAEQDREPSTDRGPAVGVPPELDPRTPIFRPGKPSAGSIFSIAAQPGTPKSVALDGTDKASERSLRLGPSFSPSLTHSGATDISASESFTSSSRATTPLHSSVRSLGFGPHHARSQSATASAADSEAGSTMSDFSGSIYSTDTRELEQTIERQRMREREMLGGEVGIGGPISAPFVHSTEFFQLHPSSSQLSLSTAATMASSPSQSILDSDSTASLVR
ncbi:hypothetical protein MVES1_003545 [Malassezia vespertilionis]|uniref:Uncharacterized protein n=1 Tax=Malassezia vespertilionis TaxID=2020962 RepID=A0A2N1J8F1_9BASI|nr:uncharacterized protein MVES1_003545 [Malassezia vespertilionis]PKI82829.1 hypothetical protein MVES_003122 [Malassezia vespertilionis]WFD08174.1 hypothetical protein MVES1_003545 [Malassezia vespertilionis]